MCNVFEELNVLKYAKCGQVLVAPKQNVFALYCEFCDDIFMQLQEFIRHMRLQHDDEFEFEDVVDDGAAVVPEVYSIDELMNGMSYKDIIELEYNEWSEIRLATRNAKKQVVASMESCVFKYMEEEEQQTTKAELKLISMNKDTADTKDADENSICNTTAIEEALRACDVDLDETAEDAAGLLNSKMLANPDLAALLQEINSDEALTIDVDTTNLEEIVALGDDAMADIEAQCLQEIEYDEISQALTDNDEDYIDEFLPIPQTSNKLQSLQKISKEDVAKNANIAALLREIEANDDENLNFNVTDITDYSVDIDEDENNFIDTAEFAELTAEDVDHDFEDIIDEDILANYKDIELGDELDLGDLLNELDDDADCFDMNMLKKLTNAKTKTQPNKFKTVKTPIKHENNVLNKDNVQNIKTKNIKFKTENVCLQTATAKTKSENFQLQNGNVYDSDNDKTQHFKSKTQNIKIKNANRKTIPENIKCNTENIKNKRENFKLNTENVINNAENTKTHKEHVKIPCENVALKSEMLKNSTILPKTDGRQENIEVSSLNKKLKSFFNDFELIRNLPKSVHILKENNILELKTKSAKNAIKQNKFFKSKAHNLPSNQSLIDGSAHISPKKLNKQNAKENVSLDLVNSAKPHLLTPKKTEQLLKNNSPRRNTNLGSPRMPKIKAERVPNVNMKQQINGIKKELNESRDLSYNRIPQQKTPTKVHVTRRSPLKSSPALNIKKEIKSLQKLLNNKTPNDKMKNMRNLNSLEKTPPNEVQKLFPEYNFNKALKVSIKRVSPNAKSPIDEKSISVVKSLTEKNNTKSTVKAKSSLEAKYTLEAKSSPETKSATKSKSLTIKKSPPESMSLRKSKSPNNTKSLHAEKSTNFKKSPLEENANSNKRISLRNKSKTPSPNQANVATNITIGANVTMDTETPLKNTYIKQNFTEATVQQTLLPESSIFSHDSKTMPHSLLPSVRATPRQRKASIDVLQLAAHGQHQQQQHVLDDKSYALLNRSARKQKVLQRMTQIRKRITTLIDVEHSDDSIVTVKNSGNRKRRSCSKNTEKNAKKLQITDITILPNIELSTSPNLVFDNFKKPAANTPTNRTTKTCNVVKATPILESNSKGNQRKKSPKSPREDLEATQLDLSDSMMDFLQNDLSQDKIDIHQLDNIMEATTENEVSLAQTPNTTLQNNNASSASTLILEELLDQVDKENLTTAKTANVVESQLVKNQNAKSKADCTENNQTIKHSENDNEHNIKQALDELELLDKIGWKPIKMSPDDTVPLKEEELMHSRAKQFIAVFEKTPDLWDQRNAKQRKSDNRELSYMQMTQTINATLQLDLSTINVRKLLNTIISWYSTQSSQILMDKKIVPSTLKYYMELLAFMPKTGRPVINCEYCDQTFRSEHAYLRHRATHTGSSPYVCMQCGRGYALPGSLKNHERTHNDADKKQLPQQHKENNERPTARSRVSPSRPRNGRVKENQKRALSPSAAATQNPPKRQQIATFNCDICKGLSFASSNELFEHKMTHLRKVFKCNVCSKILATAADLQTHKNNFHATLPNIAEPRSRSRKSNTALSQQN